MRSIEERLTEVWVRRGVGEERLTEVWVRARDGGRTEIGWSRKQRGEGRGERGVGGRRGDSITGCPGRRPVTEESLTREDGCWSEVTRGH